MVVELSCVLLIAEMPFGRVPVLDVNHPLGPKISGSLNILRYLGNKFGEMCDVAVV